MREINLEDTIYVDFTTLKYADGVPTTLLGTPVLSVMDENNATPITSGVTVTVDRASVTGLNMAKIVATAANGYEQGKTYSLYISTGTVDGVSVVGVVLEYFTIGPGATTTPRINTPAGRAYRLKVSGLADGTYKATTPVRLRPGAVDVAVSVDMRSQFGEDFVAAVATPTVSGGSVTAAALGPRDTEAMVQLSGTATAQEERTVEALVTMDNGDAVLVTFDVIVFAD